jgi:hypothetical protein
VEDLYLYLKAWQIIIDVSEVREAFFTGMYWFPIEGRNRFFQKVGD